MHWRLDDDCIECIDILRTTAVEFIMFDLIDWLLFFQSHAKELDTCEVNRKGYSVPYKAAVRAT